MTCIYGCRHFIHFNTGATEMEIPLLAQFGSAFSLLKKGCQYFCPYNGMHKSLVFGDEFFIVVFVINQLL